MIRLLHNLPFKHKLTLLTVAISGMALLIACAMFATYEYQSFRRTMARDFATMTDIFNDHVADELARNNPVAITHTLDAFAADQRILAAAVFDQTGAVVATYQREDLAGIFQFPAVEEIGQRHTESRLDTIQKIVRQGKPLGHIYVSADMSELHSLLWRFVWIVVVLLIGCSLVALLLTSGLQRFISGPIIALTEIAEKVASEQNFSVRAIKQGDDEVGRLVEGFNHLLEQLETRETELKAAHAHLEQRVEERTAALVEAKAQGQRDEARFKLIFDSVPVGISYRYQPKNAPPAGNLYNRAHLDICGLTEEEAEDPQSFKRLTHPDDQKRQLLYDQQLLAGEIDHYTLDKRYLRSDGQTVWVAFTTRWRRTDEGDLEFLTTVVDITAMKMAQEATAQQEAQLRFIIEALPFSVAWVRYKESGNESMLNRAFYRITGLSEEQLIEVDKMRKISHAEDQKKQDVLRERIDRGEIDDFTMEKRYTRPDGTLVWVNLTIAVYRGPDGRILQEVSTLMDITESKQAEIELEKLHKQLLSTSRQAGMAEVATGVLHNVGNVLNSVNVSATLVTEKVRHSKVPNLGKLSVLFDQNAADLGTYLTSDPKGKTIPAYLQTLADSLAGEQKMMLTELESLQKNIEHIKDIVAMQQSYAKTSGVTETISVPDLVEDALRMNAGSLARHDIDLVRDYQARPVVTLDKHKVLQILVNLVRNAKYACDEAGRTDKLITLQITADNRFVSIAVVDNGVGIPPDNRTRIFAHGFTTRSQGHGFGLHSSALAATEIGGSLVAHSDGLGHGATFTLKLPYKTETPTHDKSSA